MTLARARQAAQAAADVVAFVVESACVGNGVFWFLTWGALSFDWDLTARVYAGFWTHYIAASPAARHPVEAAVAVAIGLLTLGAGVVRAPHAPVFAALRRPAPARHAAEGPA